MHGFKFVSSPIGCRQVLQRGIVVKEPQSVFLIRLLPDKIHIRLKVINSIVYIFPCGLINELSGYLTQYSIQVDKWFRHCIGVDTFIYTNVGTADCYTVPDDCALTYRICFVTKLDDIITHRRHITTGCAIRFGEFYIIITTSAHITPIKCCSGLQCKSLTDSKITDFKGISDNPSFGIGRFEIASVNVSPVLNLVTDDSTISVVLFPSYIGRLLHLYLVDA